MKPLFVPLKTEYWEQFREGTKQDELRLYGPRWNERTCLVGRPVTLSKGYGTHGRMTGRICAFRRQHGSTFGNPHRDAILAVYGTLDVWIARIGIDLRPGNTVVSGDGTRGVEVGDSIECDVTHPFPQKITMRLDTPEAVAYANSLLTDEASGWGVVHAIY